MRIDMTTTQLSNKDLNDSVRYASYIQAALLPDIEGFKRILPDSFVLYRPRDIVSGDFYWIAKQKKRIALTAADCTGHGVPGAFMSIMGINFLNQINSPCIPVSGKILNLMREYVMKAMHQKGDIDDQKDGIDMSLVVIDLEKGHIEFSGANNPLIYFHKGELHVIKGDRMPIGISPVGEEAFSKHIIPFNKIDSFYIFSDGYSDQFGGYNYKKLKFKGFKQILSEINDLPPDHQHHELEKRLKKWMMHYNQIDDILVIGIGLQNIKHEAKRIQN